MYYESTLHVGIVQVIVGKVTPGYLGSTLQLNDVSTGSVLLQGADLDRTGTTVKRNKRERFI